MICFNKNPTSEFSIVIAGISDDIIFTYLCYIAKNLSDHLPNFSFQKIKKKSYQWKSWIHEICTKHGWIHSKSPLIWKQIGITGNNVSYIGNVSDFQILLYKYYKIKFSPKEEDLIALKLDSLYVEENALKVSSRFRQEKRCILLIGASKSVCFDLVPQLTMIHDLQLHDGIKIYLYDEPEYYFKLNQIVKDMEAIDIDLFAVEIVSNLVDGLRDCDILIYLDYVQRKEMEIEDWLKQNYESMEKLADQINQHAPIKMKIVFCSLGPICFNATILQTLTKIDKNNIVAVSAEYGLEIMYTFIASLGQDPKNFCCPPVWGFLGISTFVDICHMLQKYDTTSNNMKNKFNDFCLRWFYYIAHNIDPYKYLLDHKTIASCEVGISKDFQKSKAICDLLKLWYRKQNVDKEIISLGISSDGTFGILTGLVFSQPVYLKILEDDSRIWVPCKNFPLPNIPTSIFQNFILTAEYTIKKYIPYNLYEDDISSYSILSERTEENEYEKFESLLDVHFN